VAEQFDYGEAFSRNVGWVTAEEQQILRGKRVAIAGLGGVGGIHLLTLTRLGIGAFNLADFDRFGLANFNRQAGASMSALHQPKVEVMAAQARDINPELDLRLFREGVNTHNLDAFLEGVDLYVDGLDFFAFDAREATFAACARLGIPAVTAAPLGMGTAVLNFLPGGMTFEEYFRLEGLEEREKAIRFLIGLSPALLQRRYIVDPRAVDLAAHRGPSTVMACQMCAGVAATEALKILLNRGRVRAAPWGMHFDAYRNKFVYTWRPGGNNHPLQRLVLAVARRQLRKMAQSMEASSEPAPRDRVERIIELARWAPSGDNTQPWRFERREEGRFVVHGFDTRDHCVYDLDGRPSQIAIGALLENIRIAASGFGCRADVVRRPEMPEERPTYDVTLIEDATIPVDPLLPYIRIRCVQRRAMSTRPLTQRERKALSEALGPGYRVHWLEGWAGRWRAAVLMFRNAKIRLVMPEAFEVHRSIIEWNARYSRDRIPDQAVGLDPVTTRLLRWVLGSWRRVEFFNDYLAGTLLPRFQLDLLPGLRCAAHFALVAEAPPALLDDYVAAGAAVQRFWLTAAKLGLYLQPEITPLVFARYVRDGRRFTVRTSLFDQAAALRAALERLLQPEPLDRVVFLGRIGASERPAARSLRLSLNELMVDRYPKVSAEFTNVSATRAPAAPGEK
jgi:molybdopterin/thiamine biosynthesis adenylyltransferase